MLSQFSFQRRFWLVKVLLLEAVCKEKLREAGTKSAFGESK
jgi:hypothetical protein